MIKYAILLILILVLWFRFKYTFVKSNVDNRTYLVKNTEYFQESADLLGEINIRLQKLITHVSDKEYYKKNLSMYNPSKLSENILEIDTAYTVNKGQIMLFCLDDRKDKYKLHDINTMMYVAVHELAHIGCKSIGHTDEFKAVFKSLLKYAVIHKLYTYIDYSKHKETYCGINLTTNILT